jgi:xylulokinase
MPVVLGVDSSTQSTKVEVRDADDGSLVASGQAPHPATTPPRSEQDPSAWWDALRSAVREAGVLHVDAISVAAQQHGLVTVDRAGKPIRPAKLWNDTESAPQAQALAKALSPSDWAIRIGLLPVASFTISKLKWLAEREKEHFARTAKILLPHDWLTYRLAGRYVTDRGDASGTGYFSPGEGRWRPDILALVDEWYTPDDWLERLPQVLGPREAAGDAKSFTLDELGLTGHAVVGPGTGDNMAAALGIGLRPGDVAISLGTSGTVYAVAAQPTADPSGTVAGFADATGRFLPLVCVMNATQVTESIARLLGVDRDHLAAMALDTSAGASGVVLVPHLSGERTPNRPTATGTLAGLRLDTEPEQVARAAFEGVVCGLLDGLDALGNAGIDTTDGRLLLLGGGARSEAYQRILTDLAGRDVTIVDGDEHAATGACVQAAAVLHDKPPEEVAAAWDLGVGTVIEPDATVPNEAIRANYANVRA